MSKHKHADLIKAWADGEAIEFYNKTFNQWQPVPTSPKWLENIEYRLVDKFKELKEAHANGATIECRVDSEGDWYATDSPRWYKEIEYRIKPEPKVEYIPFDFSDAEFLISKVVKDIVSGTVFNINSVSKGGVYLILCPISFDLLLNQCTFLDGTPCGKIKQ